MSTEHASKPLMLVTGSSGLIGTRVVTAFARDFTVVGLDQKPPDEEAGADFVRCDLTSDEDTARARRRTPETRRSDRERDPPRRVP